MSRRRGVAKLGNLNAPVKSARKKAKAAEPTLSTAWQSILTTSSSLFEFVGDLATEDEEVAEMCATTIVKLTSAASGKTGGSIRDRFELAQSIVQKMKTISSIHLSPAENEEGKKETYTEALKLVEAQAIAVFSVCEEIMNNAPTTPPQVAEDHVEGFSFTTTTYTNVIDIIKNGALVLLKMDATGGWEYFDTISLRFFTAATSAVEKKSPTTLRPLFDAMFDQDAVDPPLGQYLRRDNLASAACVTLLTDWLWKSNCETYLKSKEGESTEENEDMIYQMTGVLRILILGTINVYNDNKSPLVSSLIKRTQQALSAALNSSSSSSMSSSSSPSVTSSDDGSYFVSLEFINQIQGVRNEEMQRIDQVMIDADEMAITLPLIIRVINSEATSLQNRQLALYCLRAFTTVSIARDELVRLGYLTSMLDAVVPYLLGQKPFETANAHDYERSVRSVFDAIVKNDPAEKPHIRLRDFPREYIEIDSPTNLMKLLFQFIRTEVQKSKSSSSNSNTDPFHHDAIIQLQYINCFMAWYDSLVRAQTEYMDDNDEKEEKENADVAMSDEKDGETKLQTDVATEAKKRYAEYSARCDAYMAAGASPYMTMPVITEMYGFFLEFTKRTTPASSTSTSSNVGIDGGHEDIKLFELRTGAVVLCARLLMEPILPNEFIEENIVKLADRVFDDLMLKSSANLATSMFSNPLSTHKSIHECRSRIHTAMSLVLGYSFKRDPKIVQNHVDLILRVIDEKYSNLNSASSAFLPQDTRQHFVDGERAAALRSFYQMLERWSTEDLGDIPIRVFTAIKANHRSYRVESQKCAIDIVGLMIASLGLFPGAHEDAIAERGVDRVLSNELRTVIIMARQFLFNIILHTPNRPLCQLAFEQISTMLVLYGQVALTHGEITLYNSNVATSSTFSFSSFSAAPSVAPLPALTAYIRVCRMFLSSRLPCQNTSLREESNQISYITDTNLPQETIKSFHSGDPVAPTANREDPEMMGANEDDGGGDDEEDPCNDDEDEQPKENVDLMSEFFATLHNVALLFTSQQYLTSVLKPLLPELRQFHVRSLHHETASAAFMINLYETLGVEMSAHRDDAIIILASCYMTLCQKDPSQMNLDSIKKTSKNIVSSQPPLDLKKILPDEAVRQHFEQMIAQEE